MFRARRHGGCGNERGLKQIGRMRLNYGRSRDLKRFVKLNRRY